MWTDIDWTSSGCNLYSGQTSSYGFPKAKTGISQFKNFPPEFWFLSKNKKTQVPNIFDIRSVKSSDKSRAWFCYLQFISDIAGTFFIVKGNFLWNIKQEVKWNNLAHRLTIENTVQVKFYVCEIFCHPWICITIAPIRALLRETIDT